MVIKIAYFPAVSINPYLQLFYNTLELGGKIEAQGIRQPYELNSKELRAYDYFHFHWNLEHLWRYYVPPWLAKLRKTRGIWRLTPFFSKISKLILNDDLRAFKRLLTTIKKSECRIIWTLHDIEPPEDSRSVDLLGYKTLSQFSDLILCHSKVCQEWIYQKYDPPCEVLEMKIGNYDGVYPAPRTRTEVLSELGLDASLPVVALLGRLRPYKGVDIACDALRHLKGDVQMIIAGAPHTGFDFEDLQGRLQFLPQVRLVAKEISDQEFADYANASEAVLLPYRKITGSAVLLSAFTLERGVIMSDLPFFRETIPSNGNAGRFFENGNSQALAQAIVEYLKIPQQIRNKAAKEIADASKWEDIVVPFVNHLSKWTDQRKTIGCKR
jgi:beta-1,4-mannosyltransferase